MPINFGFDNPNRTPHTRRQFLRMAGSVVGTAAAAPFLPFDARSVTASPAASPRSASFSSIETFVEAMNLGASSDIPFDIVNRVSEGGREGFPFKLERIIAQNALHIPDSEIIGVGRFRVQSLNEASGDQIQGGIQLRGRLATTVYLQVAENNQGNIMYLTADAQSNKILIPETKVGEADLSATEGSVYFGLGLNPDGKELSIILPDGNRSPKIGLPSSIYKEDNRELQPLLYNTNRARTELEALRILQVSPREVIAQS